jgi:iron complex outermembrane receptor protein
MTILDGEMLTSIPTNSLRDALQELPAIGFQATGLNDSNGGRGAQFTEIHQLESERTLVLMNGRRTVNTIRDSLGLAVDLQSFPTNMVERVEVLADGASAVYGSDAIAGVVNVITKSEFEGMELSFGAATPDDSGGDQYNVGLLFGTTGSRGWATAAVTYNHTDDVDFQDRSWSRLPILGVNDDGLGNPDSVVTLFGSGIPPQGRQPGANIIFEPDEATGASFQDYDTFALGPLSDDCAVAASIDCIQQINHRFNYNDIPTGISLINESSVWSGALTGEYNFDNGITGYLEGVASHREGHSNFTPLPIADAHGRFTDMIPVTFDNPHIAVKKPDALAAIQAAECGGDPAACARTFQMWWRGLDAGPRQFDYDGDTLKLTSGLKGDLEFVDRSWSWDTWFTFGRSELFEVTKDQINVARLRTAVDTAACAADADCPKVTVDNQSLEPLLAIGDPLVDIFGRNSFTQEEVDWLLFDDQEETDYEMYHIAGSITSDLFELPAGSLGFAGGLEWRREKGSVQTSGVVQAGDSGGNFAEPTEGDYNLWEVYGEFSVPLLQGAAFAEDLTLEAAVRHSDYDTFGSETTYKGALSWAPIETLRFRGVVSTGFRAPNILELFGGTADNFLLVGDPCSAPVANANRQANCTADGVPDGFVQNASQLKVSQGGNPTLDAETSDNFSVGFVWEPAFIENLRLAIDYYDVEIEDAISTPEASDTINRCYDSPGGSLSAPECDRIDRNSAGEVIRFDLLLENLNSVETSGIDVNVAYSVDTGIGQLNFDWLVNWLDEYVETTDTGAVNDRTGVVAGAISDFSGYPEWRSNFTAQLAREDWSVGVSWRYLDEMDIFDVFEFDNVHTEVDSVSYFDLDATYNIAGWSFSAGVANLTDEDPPYVPDVSANTSVIYDFLGRMYYLRVSVGWQ